MKFPKHDISLDISHNECRLNYQTVEQYLENPFGEPVFETPEERQEAIDTNEIWVIQWYPDTPIGFYWVAATTFEGALALAMKWEGDDDGSTM